MLRYFRKRARLTQDHLGRGVGYSREYIAQLEGNRQRPDPTTVAALFLPALGLTRTSIDAHALLSAAAASRGTSLRELGIVFQDEQAPVTRNTLGDDKLYTDTRSLLPQPSSIEVGVSSTGSHNPDRLHATLSWCIRMDPDAALALANALEPLWMAQESFREARMWFARILARSTSSSVSHVGALLNASAFAQRQGDVVEAIHLAEQALDECRASSDEKLLVTALKTLGWAMHDFNRLDRAMSLFQEALAIERRFDRPREIVDLTLAILHATPIWSADGMPHLQVEAHLRECEALCHMSGYAVGYAYVLRARGFFCLARSDATLAVSLMRESLALFRSNDFRHEFAWGEDALAIALLHLNDLKSARTHATRALHLFKHAEHAFGKALVMQSLATIERREGKSASALKFYQSSLRLCHAWGNMHMAARCIAGIGAVALAQGDIKKAAILLACAQADFTTRRPCMLTPFEIADYNLLAKKARAALGDVDFDAIWREGSALTLERAIALSA